MNLAKRRTSEGHEQRAKKHGRQKQPATQTLFCLKQLFVYQSHGLYLLVMWSNQQVLRSLYYSNQTAQKQLEMDIRTFLFTHTYILIRNQEFLGHRRKFLEFLSTHSLLSFVKFPQPSSRSQPGAVVNTL